MRADGLVRAFGPPSQQYLAVALGELESVEGGENSADVLADGLVACGIFLFEPSKHGCEVPGVGAKVGRVLRVPALVKARSAGRVVELEDRAGAEQVPNGPGGRRVGVWMVAARRAAQFGLLVTASQMLPRRFGGQCAALEPETLLGKGRRSGWACESANR